MLGCDLKTISPWAAAAIALAVANPAWSDPPAQTPKGKFVPPDWLRKPTEETLQAAYPKTATVATGRIDIGCIATVQGLLRNCKVIKESPPGQGFGEAALAMAPQFLFRPATLDGKPVESDVVIPFTLHCEMACGGTSIGRLLNGLIWAAAPTQEQMVAAYPPKAKAAHILGVVSIECMIRPQGLENCRTMSEEPQGHGFGRAAASLAKYFHDPINVPPGMKIAGASTRLTFTFGEQMFDSAPYVAKPKFTAAPSGPEMMETYRAAAKAASSEGEVVTGSATAKCKIGVGGILSDCAIASEAPAGKGLGQAVLTLAPKFKLSTWTDDGLPVIGTSVKLPLKFDIKDEPAPEARPQNPAEGK